MEAINLKNIERVQKKQENKMSSRIVNLINKNGYLVRRVNISEDLEELKRMFLKVCGKVGHPIPHDANGSIIWDIKTRIKESGATGVITYSEHNHEADLHTDSQYSEYPEDYFALLTLKKASCGGGISYVLKVEDIIAELNESEKGKTVLNIIQTTEYPFIVPNVFKKNKNQIEPEFNFGPILENGEMRFRVDTIQKALDYNPDFCTKEQKEAFSFLVDLVRTTKHTKKFYLEEGDLIFINNKTTLHGRSSFTDNNRHLLRIRMNKYT